MRSWLFVPASDEKKLAHVASFDADVIVLDLAGVPQSARSDARKATAKWLAENPRGSGQGVARWVRVAGVGSDDWKDDLAACVPGQPDGIVLADANDADHTKQLAAELWEMEQSARVPHGTIHILAQLATTAAGSHRIEDFLNDPPPRLTGLAWDAQALATALGASRTRDMSGRRTATFDAIRSRVLLTARARGLMAVESAWHRWRDEDGMLAAAQDARADGFTGMAVIHPKQIASVNAAFMPTTAERADASAIVKLFEDNPEASAVLLEGRMIDRPQLEQARRILSQA